MAKTSRTMPQILRKIFILIFVVYYECEASRLRNKFVHEKEISEHCLRRVVPSVFLGRQAMDAYSQVLYFSKVDLPYSCFISAACAISSCKREISVHCLRRVVPSVVLGRQAMDAYSQVLYFFKVDLDYSCFISIRAESGSNIILVVQLSSGADLKAVCDKDPNQLLVYELGETFGGYWGPQELIKKSQNMTSLSSNPNLYTLKHVVKKTEPISTPASEVSDSDELQKSGTIQNNGQFFTEAQDYITIEFPLVNVSGRFVPGEEQKENAFEDEHFDMIFNVRPSPHGAYVRTELPLVQFSMDGNSGWGYQEARNPFSPSWNKFTPVNKLKQKTQKKKIPLKLEFNSPISRWLLYDSTTPSSDISESEDGKSHEMVKQKKPLRLENRNTREDDADIISIEELMSAYNKSGLLTTITEKELERQVSQLLNKLSSLDNNQSAYIYNTNSGKGAEFLTEYTTTTNSPLTKASLLDHSHKKNQFKTHTTDFYEIGSHNKKFSFSTTYTKITTADDEKDNIGDEKLSTVTHSSMKAKSTDLITTETEKESLKVTFIENTVRPSTNTWINREHVPSTMKTNTIQLEKEKNNTLTTQAQSIVKPTTATQKQRLNNSTSITMGSLQGVDHESWDNLVQAAQVMAVRLDKTLPQETENELENYKNGIAINGDTNNPEDFFNENTNSKERPKKKRKKRFIQGIMIEDSKPRNLTTKEEKSTTTASSIEISDIQKFAQLVELVDDDIHDRAALRYLSQYVGRPIFNLCQYEQPKNRYVYLFNSSRLVISIGNFTLRRMQLVITPARRLLVGKSRCEQSYLECQVNGNRVCIDAMSACDGVANCGETDIYDEDRLMCGGYMGLRHNVCLAAITFLAVLLTLIYMVHYWLGRCVPKVSEAFFIYTEGDENVLYLNSIMRSPNDVGFAPGKSFETFEADALFTTSSTKESKFYSCIKKCLPCLFKKANDNKLDSREWDNFQLSPSNTMYTFPELEIHKMMNEQFKDVSVQTGESLEMKYFPPLDKTLKEDKAVPSEEAVAKSTSPVSNIELKRAKDELSRLKFFNQTRQNSLKACHSSLLLDGSEQYTKPLTNYEPSRNSEESEITSLSYDDLDRRDLGKTSVKNPRAEFSTEADVHTQKQQSKQLRFNEDVVNIPRDDNNSEEEISALQYDAGRRNTETFEESEPTIPSTSRDFKRFWVGSKGKKKKKTITLPRNY